MYRSIEASVAEIFNAPWNIAKGTKVPETEDVVMKKRGAACRCHLPLRGPCRLLQNG